MSACQSSEHNVMRKLGHAALTPHTMASKDSMWEMRVCKTVKTTNTNTEESAYSSPKSASTSQQCSVRWLFTVAPSSDDSLEPEGHCLQVHSVVEDSPTQA